MFQIRIHGRGGQGVVTAAEVLSIAAFIEGREAQAFPSFGSERMGAPVMAFCRIDDKPIRSREPVSNPDALIVQDPTLLANAGLFAGIAPEGFVLINSEKHPKSLELPALANLPSVYVATVAAGEIARRNFGKPVPNLALLGGMLAETGILRLESLKQAIGQKFPGRIGSANAAAAEEAYNVVLGARARFPRELIMFYQIEGSLAVAKAVALCRPEVVSCYPITPQTHIVEAVSALVKSGELSPCEFVNVESEFAAMSLLIGASAAGARTYTATSSQGLLFMAEALFNASGLGLPIVMTDGNRAIGAPINIWNDHSDTMSMRDCGWIQLHAESNQEAIDLHIQAYKLAEQLSIPVMVCVDGFILTHAYEKVDLPTQKQVDDFLPPYEPIQVLDVNDPVSIGAMVGPDAYTEVRYLLHHKHILAVDLIEQIARDFNNQFRRPSGGLITSYRTEGAETVLVALGSVNGTIQDTVDELRDDGVKIGSIKITSFRPFPLAALRDALQDAKRVIVVEKYLAPGLGGILASNIRMALRGLPTKVGTIVAGLGGRAILKGSLREALALAICDELEEPYFLDMNWDLIRGEIDRAGQTRRSGPTAEHVLKALRENAATREIPLVPVAR